MAVPNSLRTIDREALNSISARLIDPDNMALIIVGDEAAIRTELEALDLPIVELDEDGFLRSEAS